MRIVILNDQTSVAEAAADIFVDQVSSKPDSVLGLATGSTPIALYKVLCHRFSCGKLSLKGCATFNLDEYVGLEGHHEQSYRTFMNKHLFRHVDLLPQRIHMLDGVADDPVAECRAYEDRIREAGGIDLQLLGIGQNGHIGFNEPSSSLASRTRIKTLTPNTIEANRRFFSADEFQPRLALTMGIGTIMETRHVLLLATGKEKAEAVRQAVEGSVSARCPASVLQFHPRATLLLDGAAASRLEDTQYYLHAEDENRHL